MVLRKTPEIMLVEDEISISMELEEMLNENGYRVSGVAASGEEAVLMAGQLAPDLVLMDIKLPGKLDGIEAAARIRSRMNIQSVFLTGHGQKSLVERALKAAPLGYILKPLNKVQILAAIALALSEIMRTDDANNGSSFKRLPAAFLVFSEQELRVATMIREGKNSSEIAEHLGLSKDTVKWHRKRIRSKLGIANRSVDLMAWLRCMDEN